MGDVVVGKPELVPDGELLVGDDPPPEPPEMVSEGTL